jgi:hypothetical protein
MHCPMCARVMLSRSSQTIEEENAALVVTSLWCRPCNQSYEEIWASERYRGTQPQRLFYPVQSIVSPAPPVTRRPRRMRRNSAYAVVG